MGSIESRLRRIESQHPTDEPRKVVRGIGQEDADLKEAELRASGYAGAIFKIVRVIVDPPQRAM